MIKVINISKTFKTKNGTTKVLEGINLNIDKGDIFGVIGVSGAGKSTLLRILANLETATEGVVMMDGVDISTKKNDLNFKRKVGFITQNYALLMQRTVLENVAFPLELTKTKKDIREQKAREMLEIVGLADKANCYPSTLSGGQKQRVAIARALITNPPILLCDEPTSALDSMTTCQILDLLKKINKEFQVTIVMITHNMNVVKDVCNKVAVIDHARILEQGLVTDIIARPKNQMTIDLLGHLYQGGAR